MKRNISLFAASLALLATPAMAAAPMKTSAPSKPVVTSAAPAAATSDRFRPTSFLGVHEARTLGSGDVVMGLNGLSASWGVVNDVEVGANASFNFNAANTTTFSIPAGAFAKGILLKSEKFNVALGGKAGLTLANTGTNFGLNAGAFLPISFWNVGPGDLHVVPSIDLQLTPAAAFGSNNMNMAVGYTLPVNEKWTLHLADRYNFGGSNTLELGNRVAFNPNLTVDVGSIALTSGGGSNNFGINLLTMNAFFGAPSAELTKAWGL